MKNVGFVAAVVCLCALFWVPSNCYAQALGSYERQQLHTMLKDVDSSIRKHFYDDGLNGVDWDTKVRQTDAILEKSTSAQQALAEIAALVDTLQDAQTIFVPPTRTYRNDYGFLLQIIADHCYVIRVRPGSDAEARGIRAGDQILAVDGYTPTRNNIWRLYYILNLLSPQPLLKLKLADTNGVSREVTISSHVTRLPVLVSSPAGGHDPFEAVRTQDNSRMLREVRYADRGDQLLIVKLPFSAITANQAEEIAGKMRKHKAAILDLRDASLGTRDGLQLLLGALLGKDVTIADRVMRSSHQLLQSKARGKEFSGKVAILVDSSSTWGAELFARVVQLEKRGSVIGDRTAGLVMDTQNDYYRSGTSSASFYGIAVADATFIMKDGLSPENVGVTPDLTIVPTPSDLAASCDPAMAKAAELVGVKMTPEESGALFPFEWPKQ